MIILDIDLVMHHLHCFLYFFTSDDNLSEDDINECEKEDPLHEDDSVPHSEPISKKKKKKDISVR